MVVQGDFVVRLVDATTKEPFKEHTPPDGKTYAEVEPNADYFVQIQALSATKEARVQTSVRVDGQDLGYYVCLSSDKEYDMGSWSRKNGMSIRKPLRFESIPCSSSASVSGDPLGAITVTFCEAIEDGLQDPMEDYIPPPFVLAAVDGKVGQKAVRSSEGTQVSTKRIRQMYTSYRAGRLLKTISIHYGTALGLIKANVLSRPPFWELAKMRFPALEVPALQIEPMRFTTDPVVRAGVVVTPGKDVEIFDLSCLSDDEDAGAIREAQVA